MFFTAKITNVDVFGLESSIFRSGYPMLDRAPTEDEFKEGCDGVLYAIRSENLASNQHIRRAVRLAQAKGGGHDQFLTGIHVNFDLTLSNKAWVEAERYVFLDFISSMSTMHRAAVFPISHCCNDYTSLVEIAEAERLRDIYNSIDGEKEPEEKKEAYLHLLYSLPSGFELMAGMTTNYRCLKNIYAQRKNHRLPDWHIVCDWIKTLPLANYLITGEAMI